MKDFSRAKARRLWAMVLALLSVCGAPGEEPTHEGKTAREWLTVFEVPGWSGQLALHAFWALGTNGVPVLLEALREPVLIYDGNFAAYRAARGRRLGARLALRGLEPEAVRAADSLLTDKNAEHRAFGVELFASKLGAAALPELIWALDDPHQSVVQAALIAVGGLGLEGEPALPKLEQMLFHHALTETAARSIAKIGLAGLPILLAGLQSQGETEKVRWASAAGFSEGNAEFRARAVADLLILLEREDVRLQTVVARALRNCGPEAREAIPVLRDFLRGGECGFEVDAIEALRSIGIDSEETIEVLKAKCESGYAPTRGYALRALAEVSAGREELLPLFLRGLASDYWLEQAAGAQGAGELGEAAERAVPRITELLKRIVSGKEERGMNNTDRQAIFLDALSKITGVDMEELRLNFGIEPE